MSRSAPPTGGPKPTYKHFYQDDMATREGRSSQPQSPKTSDSSQGSAKKGRNQETSLSRIPRARDSSTSSSSSSGSDRRPARRAPARRRRYSDEYSRSPSPRRGRRASFYEAIKADLQRDPEDDKPWWQRKTLWATIASIASVASVAASAQATRQSAQATRQSAQATRQSASASHRVADYAEIQCKAAVNTAVASGHMDHSGRYTGPGSSAAKNNNNNNNNNNGAGHDDTKSNARSNHSQSARSDYSQVGRSRGPQSQGHRSVRSRSRGRPGSRGIAGRRPDMLEYHPMTKVG